MRLRTGWITLGLVMAFTLLFGGCAPARVQTPAPTDAPTAIPQPSATPAATATEVVPTIVPPTPTTEAKAIAPAATAASGETPAGTDELAIGQLKHLNQLDSYRMASKLSWKQEDGSEGTMEVSTEMVRQPPAQRIVVTNTAPGREPEQLELRRVNGVTYTNYGGEWAGMLVSSDDVLDEVGWVGGPEQLLGDSVGRLVGTETVNGLETRHYRYDKAQLEGIQTLSELKDGYADVWVSTEYEVYIKAVIHLEGLDPKGTNSALDLEVNLDQVNQPISIVAPEGIEAPGLPADIPVMEGALDLSMMSGVASFRVERPLQEVIDYYKQAMAAQGWELFESSESMFGFAKGERSVAVMIAEEDGTTVVSIMVTAN